MNGSGAAVAAMAMSASLSASAAPLQGTARPPWVSARRSALAMVRLTTVSEPIPTACRRSQARRAMVPAPNTTARARPADARRAATRSTAADASEVAWRAMPVSVRTRLPAWTAAPNSAFSTGPALPASVARARAAATWRWTSVSPRSMESSPAATRIRWRAAEPSRTAVSADRAAGGKCSRSTPRSHSACAGWLYTSQRWQVDRSAHSGRGPSTSRIAVSSRAGRMAAAAAASPATGWARGR